MTGVEAAELWNASLAYVQGDENGLPTDKELVFLEEIKKLLLKDSRPDVKHGGVKPSPFRGRKSLGAYQSKSQPPAIGERVTGISLYDPKVLVSGRVFNANDKVAWDVFSMGGPNEVPAVQIEADDGKTYWVSIESITERAPQPSWSSSREKAYPPAIGEVVSGMSDRGEFVTGLVVSQYDKVMEDEFGSIYPGTLARPHVFIKDSANKLHAINIDEITQRPAEPDWSSSREKDLGGYIEIISKKRGPYNFLVSVYQQGKFIQGEPFETYAQALERAKEYEIEHKMPLRDNVKQTKHLTKDMGGYVEIFQTPNGWYAEAYRNGEPIWGSGYQRTYQQAHNEAARAAARYGLIVRDDIDLADYS